MTNADSSHEAFMALLDSLETDQRIPELQPEDAADLMFARQLLACRDRPAAPLKPPWLTPQAPARDALAAPAASGSRRAARLLPGRPDSGASRPAGRPARVDVAALAGAVAVVALILWSTARQPGQNVEGDTVPAVMPPTSIRPAVGGSPGAVMALPSGMPAAPSATSTLWGVAAYPPPGPSPTDSPAPPTTVATAVPPSPPPATRASPVASTRPIPTDESAYPEPLETATPPPIVTRVAPPPVPTAPPTDTAVVPTPPATPTDRPAPPTPTGARPPDADPPDHATTVRASLDVERAPRNPIPARRMPQ